MPLGQVLKELGELVFPPRCQVCRAFSRLPLCESCRAGFETIREPLCECCGRPFDPRAIARESCPDCAPGRRRLSGARSFGIHVGRLRDAVNALKFRGRLRLVEPLGELLSQVLRAEPPVGLSLDPRPEAIVPVPLHPARRRERGFDQAERLAAILSAATGIPLREGLLVRTRYTNPQIGLGPAERRQNVKGAFALRYPLPTSAPMILLVDDVYTTGATLEECARTLDPKRAGKVFAVTVTRAAPEWHPEADLTDRA
ncbi:MAG: ComF family protein [Armatimonadetes bacterium]|nr:ComF family protein [Armatimonadota bacterium]